MSEPKTEVTPQRILSSGLDCEDLKILRGMLADKSYEDIATELGYPSKSRVLSKLKTLEEKGIIIKGKRRAPVIDVVKIYNNVMVTLIKLHLAATVPVAAATYLPTAPPTGTPPAWLSVVDVLIKALSPEFRKFIRFAFPLIGTDWDIILVTTVQSMDEYARFMSELQGKTGLIDKVWGMRVIENARYYYDPISIPEIEEIEKALKWTKESASAALGKSEESR